MESDYATTRATTAVTYFLRNFKFTNASHISTSINIFFLAIRTGKYFWNQWDIFTHKSESSESEPEET